MKTARLILALTLPLLPMSSNAEERSWFDLIRDKINNTLEIYEVALEFHYIENGIREYEEDKGRSLPPAMGLQTLVTLGYLSEDDIEDPWGTSYRYRRSLNTTGGYIIYLFSAGPDRIHGTDDDLAN